MSPQQDSAVTVMSMDEWARQRAARLAALDDVLDLHRDTPRDQMPDVPSLLAMADWVLTGTYPKEADRGHHA